MARPRKNINQKQFESLCGIQCTKEEICSVLEVTEKTLNKWCNETYGMDFSLVFRQKKDFGRMSLRRQQWKLAEKGNSTMLIWLGKQMLNQSENPTQDEVRMKELELREREIALKEKLAELKLNNDNNEEQDDILLKMLEGLRNGI